jgi:hypothetical protein
VVDSALTEQQEMQPGEQSERFCCYFPGGPAPNGESFREGYYTRFAWIFVLGHDGLPEDLVTGAGPSIDTLPPGYRVKTEPIDVIEASQPDRVPGSSQLPRESPLWGGPWD